MLVRMCILSGCDYLDNLSGVGIKTAYKLVKKYKYTEKVGFRVSMFDNTFQIIDALKKRYTLPEAFHEDFIKAELTFRHQRVWDVINQKLTTLTPLPEDVDEKLFDFVGPYPFQTVTMNCSLTFQNYRPRFSKIDLYRKS